MSYTHGLIGKQYLNIGMNTVVTFNFKNVFTAIICLNIIDHFFYIINKAFTLNITILFFVYIKTLFYILIPILKDQEEN